MSKGWKPDLPLPAIFDFSTNPPSIVAHLPHGLMVEPHRPPAPFIADPVELPHVELVGEFTFFFGDWSLA